MAQPHHTPRLAQAEEALTVLFCLVDDAYALLNPRGARRYESIKRLLSDSEVITLALFQQLRGVESERSFSCAMQRERFFSELFPGVVGLYPSSFHRRVRKLRGFLEPLRRELLSEMVGDPERRCWWTRLCFRFCTPGRSLRARALLWGGVGKVGFLQRLRGEAASHLCHQWDSSLLRAHPANVADVSLSEELISTRQSWEREGSEEALLGDLAYRSEELKEVLDEMDILLVTKPSERRAGVRQQVERSPFRA
jgi:hypothetical protein